jgi:hypothetical protein
MSDTDKATTAWKISPTAYWLSRPAEYQCPVPVSRYLKMRDGVRIAIDVYVPLGPQAPDSFPTVMVATPYYRRFKTRNPNAEAAPMVFRYRDTFVPRGYAMVIVDVRGTGASFGSRDSFRSPKEREDFAEIAQWITEQTWSNGIIGATGISYPGAASLFLASTGHPAVKAIAPLFAMNDIYTEQLFPGGLLSKIWTEDYNDCIVALDHNNTEKIKQYAYFGDDNLLGPCSVDEDVDGSLLEQAMQEHKQSFNLHDAAPEYAYRSEGLMHDPALTLDICSPFSYYDHFKKDVAIYSVSGWYDGSGYSNAAISRFLSLQRPNHFLLLGPWDHGARTNGSPWRDTNVPRFNLFGEVLRFFDQYLMGLETGIEQESRVHYFSVHAEQWHPADTWPPHNSKQDLFLYANQLTHEKKTTEQRLPYQVDFTTSTGRNTRYERLGLHNIVDYYGDWDTRQSKLLSFTSAPFETSMELTGHPIIRLSMTCSESDAALFVYISEIDANGKAHYVTEGMLRALHRATSSPPKYLQSTWTYRSFLRQDAKALKKGAIDRLEFALLPVSWVFSQGSQLRVSVAGADAQHFGQVPHGRAPKLEIICGGEDGSKICLPIRVHDASVRSEKN